MVKEDAFHLAAGPSVLFELYDNRILKACLMPRTEVCKAKLSVDGEALRHGGIHQCDAPETGVKDGGELIHREPGLGGEEFAGEESICKNGQAVYAMNYMGRVLSEGFSGNFLKEALRAADKKMPYRGPELYQSGEYMYRCKVTGDFTWFQGYEEIYHNDSKVYECVFHGGTLK